MSSFVKCSLIILLLTGHTVLKGQEKPKVYEKVDEVAYYKGGKKAWSRYLVRNLVYPESAKSKGIEGTVDLSLIISAEGGIAEAIVLDSPNNAMTAAALKVVYRSTKKWKAGKKDDKPVYSKVRVMIIFKLK